MGDNTRAATAGGDTARSGLTDPAGPPPTALERITRQIIRHRRPSGPDEAAVELLKAWRRIFKFETDTGVLPARPIAAILHRIDPLVRFMVLARLVGTEEGRGASILIPDASISEAIVQGLLSIDRSEESAARILQMSRPRGASLARLIGRVGEELEAQDASRVPLWEKVRAQISD